MQMRLQNAVQLEKQGFIPPNWQGSTRLQSPAALNAGPLLGSTTSDISEHGILSSVLYSFVFTVNSTIVSRLSLALKLLYLVGCLRCYFGDSQFHDLLDFYLSI